MARDENEVLPQPASRLEKQPLDMLGIDELNLYIKELLGEIDRVKADINRKRSHRSAADAFFRKSE